MLQTRKIVKNEDGSYSAVFGQGNANLINGANALAQILTHQLLTIKGELPTETNYGVSWLAHDNPNSDIQIKNSQIKNIIINNPYVIRIMEYTSNFNNQTNNFNVYVKVLTSDGILELNL